MKWTSQRIKKILNPHVVIVTIIIWGVILLLDFVRLNLHFLDPFNNGLKNYEITDIVSSRLRDTDLIDFEDQIVLVNTGKPDRYALAGIIDKLNRFAPRVIGIDILLEDKKDPLTDSILVESLKSASNVVLANRLKSYDESTQIFDPPVGCEPMFMRHAQTGFVNFVSKDNWTVRLFKPKVKTLDGEKLAFATKIAELANPEAFERLLKRDNKTERIHYFGNSTSFAKFDTSHLFDQSLDLTEKFKDKIVLIGYMGSDEWNMPMKDRYFTPLNEQYVGRSLPDMFGLVIHANIISMILRNNYIYEVPGWVAHILEIIFSYANVLFIFWIYKRFPEPFHGITRIVQILEFVLVFLLISILFHYFKIRIDFGKGILALLLIYDFVMIYESFIRQRIKALQHF